MPGIWLVTVVGRGGKVEVTHSQFPVCVLPIDFNPKYKGPGMQRILPSNALCFWSSSLVKSCELCSFKPITRSQNTPDELELNASSGSSLEACLLLSLCSSVYVVFEVGIHPVQDASNLISRDVAMKDDSGSKADYVTSDFGCFHFLRYVT